MGPGRAPQECEGAGLVQLSQGPRGTGSPCLCCCRHARAVWAWTSLLTFSRCQGTSGGSPRGRSLSPANTVSRCQRQQDGGWTDMQYLVPAAGVHQLGCGSCLCKPMVGLRYQCVQCPRLHLCQVLLLGMHAPTRAPCVSVAHGHGGCHTGEQGLAVWWDEQGVPITKRSLWARV